MEKPAVEITVSQHAQLFRQSNGYLVRSAFPKLSLWGAEILLSTLLFSLPLSLQAPVHLNVWHCHQEGPQAPQLACACGMRNWYLASPMHSYTGCVQEALGRAGGFVNRHLRP